MSMKDAANTHIMYWGGKLLALYEVLDACGVGPQLLQCVHASLWLPSLVFVMCHVLLVGCLLFVLKPHQFGMFCCGL